MAQDAKRDSHREAIDKALGRLVEVASAVGDRSHRIATEMLGSEQPTEARPVDVPPPAAWLPEVHERIQNATHILQDASADLGRIATDVVTQQPTSIKR